MAFNNTTLTNAIGANDTVFAVGSTTNITVPNFTTGTGLTYLWVEQEAMLVVNVPVSGTVSVQRGILGTATAAHGASAPVLIGLPTDFVAPAIPIKAQTDYLPPAIYGSSAPVASATTITATGPIFHVTGTTSIATINPPPGYIGGGEGSGAITIIFDGVAAWTAAGNIAVAGTPTTAGSTVSFLFDQSTGKWNPSRLA